MFVIGICGGSGAGKTSLVHRVLASDLGRHIACLHHDAYYRNRELMPPAVAALPNFDHPESLDNDLYLKHIEELRGGHSVEEPFYDFALHRRTGPSRRVEARPVLLLDGILLFAIDAIRDRIDLRVYVETPDDLRVVRRMIRDVSERGRHLEAVRQQYETTVRPMHRQLVEPSRQHAHVIIPWHDYNDEAVRVILSRVRDEVARR